MSRVINLSVAESDVVKVCRKQNVPISAIESLVCGGTRLVLMDATATSRMTKVFGRKVISGPVTRFPLRSWPR